MTPGTKVDLADVQGNILRSYGRHFGFVRHLVLRVADPVRARAALGDMCNGDRKSPEITSAEPAPRQQSFKWCLNIGVTYRGLVALGLPPASLRTFPREFREGMVARASWLGDVGESDPSRWIGGLADPEQAHLIVTVHGHRAADLDFVADAVVGAGGGRAFSLATPTPFDGAMFTGPHTDKVHFGFLDGLSNVRFEGIHEPGDASATGAYAPLGAVLLGHPSPIPHVTWSVPNPPELGFNGSFNAFRVLRQDVVGFEAFLRRAGADVGCSAEEVAAKMCGRWRNGAPLTLAPTEAEADDFADPRANTFGYVDDGDGARCPLGSHIRRSNPRDSYIVQRGTNNSRPLVRRGMPYGPPYVAGAPDDGVARGLLGNFLCASLGAQFEALQFSWLNLGLQDPRITGTNDPLVGANEPETASFEFRTATGDAAVIRDLPNFVRTEGGAYTFLPSLSAIRWIAAGRWSSTESRRSRRLLPTMVLGT